MDLCEGGVIKMLEIECYQPIHRKYRELAPGPFPVKVDQLRDARKVFADEQQTWNGSDMAPRSAADSVLKRMIPALHSFDRMVLAYAVCFNRIRVREEGETEWKVLKR